MPSVSRAVSAWASRWFTAIRGLRVTSASALAVVSPTSTPPIRPGPAAAAMPSTSFDGAVRVLQRAGDQPVDHLHMGARRDLRHHAAIGGMLGDLAQDLVGQDLAASVEADADHGGRGLVAGGLDAENAHELLAVDWS